MKRFVGRHEAVSEYDFAELALGTPPELWLGVPGETDVERAARLDAGLDLLADDPDLSPAVVAVVTTALESRPGLLAALIPAIGGAR